MSRPKKMHKPIKGNFNNILAAIGAGTRTGKQPPDLPISQAQKSAQKTSEENKRKS